MTAQSAIPLKWYVPFAQGDSARVELPVTTADATRASQTLGFPPLTMQPPESGGVPPQGEDFNGGMNQVARIAWWVLNCGQWQYDATFAANANINGYPKGAYLQSADSLGDWINTTDNNQNNPDTNGTNWVPGFQYGETPITGLTGPTSVLTPAQAAKESITLAGTLGSALTVILPAWTKNWTITNNTTGPFATTVKTPAGSGVVIPQNGSPTRVYGDGANIVQAPENIALGTQPTHAAQISQIPASLQGGLINVQVFSVSGTYTPTSGTNSIIVEGVGGGGGGGGSPATGAGQQALGAGGSSGTWGVARFTSGFAGGLAFTIGAGGAGGVGGVSPAAAGGSTTLGTIATFQGGFGGGNGATSSIIPAVTGPIVSATVPSIVGGTLLAYVSGRSGPGFIALGTTPGTCLGGNGGDSPLGNGGANALSAQGVGGGGAGAAVTASEPAHPGGNGAAGCLIIYEYA